MTETSTRVLVVAGGVGGVAAALAAARRGSDVVLTERTDWLGGQLTSQDIALDVRGPHGAVSYADSVGLGCYRIDLHPSTGGDPYLDIGCRPYELPLRALLPVRMDNLLPGAKNIGTTHITNGTYRMPPVEWNAGEVAGHLTAFCAERRVPPRGVRGPLLADFQAELTSAGVELRWPRVEGY